MFCIYVKFSDLYPDLNCDEFLLLAKKKRRAKYISPISL